MIDYKHSKLCEFPPNPCDLDSTDPESMCDNCLNEANITFNVFNSDHAESERPVVFGSIIPTNRYKTWNKALESVQTYLGQYFRTVDPRLIKPNTNMYWGTTTDLLEKSRYVIIKIERG